MTCIFHFTFDLELDTVIPDGGVLFEEKDELPNFDTFLFPKLTEYDGSEEMKPVVMILTSSAQ